MSVEPGGAWGQPAPDAAALRAHVQLQCQDDAAWFREVAAATARWQAELLAEEREIGPLFPRSLRYTSQQLHDLVLAEVAVLLGVTHHAASVLVRQARALATVVPAVLTELEAGRLDRARVAYLLDETEHLDPAVAVSVAAAVLAEDRDHVRALGIPVDQAGVWDLPRSQDWRRQVRRTIARETTRVDDPSAPVPRVPQVHVTIDDVHHGELVFTGTAEDVTRLHQRIQDLADSMPPDLRSTDGTLLSLAERDGVALLGLCGNRTGVGTVGTSTHRRELGLVVHVDTLFGDGPSAHDPGELRDLPGSGQPLPVPAPDARALAQTALTKDVTTCLLLADDRGRLVRRLRLGPAPAAGWTRQSLIAAGRRALESATPLTTAAHDPTVAIDEHVRAAHPVSVAPGRGASTASGSRRVDLDHRIPHPRGPTSVENLQPLSRTPHRHKTRALWHCRTSEADEHAVTWTTRLGAAWTYRPAPLPGFARGEGHGATS